MLARQVFLALVMQLILEKENSEFKQLVLHLKIDPVSHLAQSAGAVKYTESFSAEG